MALQHLILEIEKLWRAHKIPAFVISTVADTAIWVALIFSTCICDRFHPPITAIGCTRAVPQSSCLNLPIYRRPERPLGLCLLVSLPGMLISVSMWLDWIKRLPDDRGFRKLSLPEDDIRQSLWSDHSATLSECGTGITLILNLLSDRKKDILPLVQRPWYIISRQNHFGLIPTVGTIGILRFALETSGSAVYEPRNIPNSSSFWTRYSYRR